MGALPRSLGAQNRSRFHLVQRLAPIFENKEWAETTKMTFCAISSLLKEKRPPQRPPSSAGETQKPDWIGVAGGEGEGWGSRQWGSFRGFWRLPK